MDLSYKTLPVTAAHFDGTLEYNVHNLFGLYEVVASAQALQRLRNARQFILTRYGSALPLALFKRLYFFVEALRRFFMCVKSCSIVSFLCSAFCICLCITACRLLRVRS